MMVLAIGDFQFTVHDDGRHEPEGIAWSVEIGSKRKVDEKVAEKDDDAHATDKGREVRSVTIKLSCNDDPESLARLGPIIEKLDPSQAKPGNPPAFAYERHGFDIAKAKNVRAILIKEAKGPNVADTGVVSYEITASSWAQPKPSPGAGTPKDSQKFVLNTVAVQNFGGIPGNTVTFPPGTTVQKPDVPKP